MELRWLKPSVALVAALLLLAGMALAGAWTLEPDPASRTLPDSSYVGQEWCRDRGVAALALAGTSERADALRDCPQWGAPGSDARSAVDRDTLFVLAYVLALVGLCLYGSLRARRAATRRASRLLAGVAVLAGACDLAENEALRAVLRSSPASTTAVDVAYGFSLARWVLVVPPAIYAVGALVASLSRTTRTVVGQSAWPGFAGSLAHLDDPPRPAAGPTVPDLQARRLTPPGSPPPPRDPGGPVGLCFSGGGIRAASVAMGALGALDEAGVYRRSDYLASVSGGGYTAGAAQFVARADANFGTEGPPPFAPGSGERDWVAERARFLWPAPEKGQLTASTRAFATGVSWAFAGIVFNVALVVSLLYLVIRPVGWALHGAVFANFGAGVTRTAFTGVWIALPLALIGLVPILGPGLWNWIVHFRTMPRLRPIVVPLLVAGVVIGIGALARYGLPASSWWNLLGDNLVGHLLVLAGIVALAAAGSWLADGDLKGLPGLMLLVTALLVGANWLEDALNRGVTGDVSWRPVLVLGAVVAGFVVALLVGTALRLLPWARPSHLEARDIPSARVTLPLAALAALAGVVTAVVVVSLGAEAADRNVAGSELAVWLGLLGVLVATYVLLDQKRWSPHPIYKRRLASSFSPIRVLPDERNPSGVQALPYGIHTTLSEWAAPAPGRPQLLVCAAAYDTRGVEGEVKAWPFVFAHDYVGGADVGWTRTIDFEAALGRTNQADGTLLAAMAISGAAVSPGLGQVRLGSLNAAISLFNARLGVWLPSPRYVNELRQLWTSAEGPALRWLRLRRFSYLLKEIAGVHDLEDRFVYVTDGGQFDNLGLLELLSRRCRLIVAVDASGDTPLTTGTFDNVRQLAYDRYGIRFSIDGWIDPPLDDPPVDDRPVDDRPLAGDTHPQPGDVGVVPPAAPNRRQRLSARAGRMLAPTAAIVQVRRHPDGRLTRVLCTAPDEELAALDGRTCLDCVVTLTVHYPALGDQPATTGTLVYAKAVLTPDGPPAVLDFARRRSARRFPSDSTADQWPDRAQFDSYVALGAHVGTRAAAAALAVLDPPPNPSAGPAAGAPPPPSSPSPPRAPTAPT